MTPRVLSTIPLQMLLKAVTCQPNLAFDHLSHQLLVWFVYIHHSSIFFQQPSEISREHIPFKVKARRRRECFGDRLRELDRVGGGKDDLYSGRRAYKVEFSKLNDLHVLSKPHFWVATLRATVRAFTVCGSAMYYEGYPVKYCFMVGSVWEVERGMLF